jgi:hypothetical protein
MEIGLKAVATELGRVFGATFAIRAAPAQRGMLTWASEGSDQPGQFFSRLPHFPGGASGVTIGRGYDMKLRTGQEIFEDLTASGVPSAQATELASGAGLTGASASTFARRMRSTTPPISVEAEQRLFFALTYPRYVADTKRIFESRSVQERYGRATWEMIDGRIQDLLVDLRYRGDYTPRTRTIVQRLAARNDVEGLARVMSDRSLWLQVPIDRFRRRAEWL